MVSTSACATPPTLCLPALRKALQSFTKRADIIIRQMSYLASQQHNDVLAVCKHLAGLPEAQQNALLEQAGERMAVPEIALVDPAQVRLAPPRQRFIASAAVDEGKGDVGYGRPPRYLYSAGAGPGVFN